MKRLYRSRTHSVIGGVCGGIAEYFAVDPIIVRLVWVLSAFLGGAGLFAYVVAWIIIPLNPSASWDDDWHWSTQVRKDRSGLGTTDPGPSDVTDSPGPSARASSGDGPRTFGLILVAVGAYLLLRNFLPHLALGRFWPVLLIAIGVLIVMGAVRSDR